MKVQLKLFATLRQYLPPDAQGSTCKAELPVGAQVSHLLTQFDLSEDKSLVILVNGRRVDPDQILEENDVVAVFPAMAGG